MVGGEEFELADQLGVLAERQVGLDPLCQTVEARLLQAADLGPSEGLVAEVRQRRAAPHHQRLAQHAGGGGRLAGCQLPASLCMSERESCRVELRGLDLERVAGRPRANQGRVTERLTKPRDPNLQRRRRVARPVPPELLDQPVDRDRLARPNQQTGQQRLLARAAEADLVRSSTDLQGS